MSMGWNEVFITGEVKEGMTRSWAVATALGAWGACMSGLSEIPDNFGKGMAGLSLKYDIPATHDELSVLSKNLTPADYKVSA